jgi:ABC-2 type transport system permease protein
MLALGGGMFAALMGISALSGEEGRKTAEFLLTHPLKRSRVALEKLLALVLTVFAFNAVYILLTLAAFAAMGGVEDMKAFWVFQLAQFLMQIELGCICFALSAVMRKIGAGIGLGIAALLYFMNIMANISTKAEALKYVTPFNYSDAANVMSSGKIDMTLAGIGLALTVISAVFGVLYYSRKDIHA